MFKRNRNGFSLLELMLVLAITAAMAIAAFFIFSKIEENRKADDQAKIVMATRNEIISLFASQGSYPDTLSNVFKAINPNSDNYYRNKWNGTFNVRGNYGLQGDNSNKGFTFTISGVSQQGCVRFISDIWRDFSKITVNSTIVYNKTNVGTATDYNISTLVAACTKSSDLQVDYVENL